MKIYLVHTYELDEIDRRELSHIRSSLNEIYKQGAAIMADLSKLTASVARLEAQAAINKQLLKDILAALLAAQSAPTDQAALDDLQARVDAVTTGEAADDAAAQGTITPVTNMQASYPDLASFQADLGKVTTPDEVLLDGVSVRAGTAAGGSDAFFTHSDQGGVINMVGPTS